MDLHVDYRERRRKVTTKTSPLPGTHEVRVGKASLGFRGKRCFRGPFSVGRGRYREIERLVQFRHPEGLPPDDPLARIYLEVLAHHIAHLGDGVWGYLLAWCRRYSPAMPHEWIEEVAGQVEGPNVKLRKWKAYPLAELLQVTLEERDSLGIKTIGVAGLTRAQVKKIMKERRRERDCERQAQKRRAAGARTAEEIKRNSDNTLEPWSFAGISKRTFRRRSPEEQEVIRSAARAARDGQNEPKSATLAPARRPILRQNHLCGDAAVPSGAAKAAA